MVTSVRTAIDDARASAVPASGTLPTVGVVLALGRIEAKHLLRHPVFWLSSAFSLLLLRGAVGQVEGGGIIPILTWLVGGVAVGVLMSTVLTANVAGLRPRRDHMRELYGSMPAPAEALTAGVLAGIVLGLGVLSVIVAGLSWLVLERAEGDLREFVDVFVVTQYVLAVLALGTLGVAVARWVPSVLGGPLVLVVYVFTGMMWAVPWIAPTSSGIDVGWHLTYLVAVIAGCTALAFARDRRTMTRFVVGVAALGLAALAGVQQTPPGGY